MVLAALVAGFGVALPTEGEHGVALLAAESQTQLVVKWPKGQEDAPTVCAHQLPLNWCGAWLDDQGIDGKPTLTALRGCCRAWPTYVRGRG